MKITITADVTFKSGIRQSFSGTSDITKDEIPAAVELVGQLKDFVGEVYKSSAGNGSLTIGDTIIDVRSTAAVSLTYDIIEDKD